LTLHAGSIVMASLAAFGLAACSADVEAPFKPASITPFLEEAVLGDPAAPVEIIEYASTTCGGCYQLHTTIMPELKTTYIDTGKAKLLYRVLPTSPAPVSAAGAAIARCAGKDKFHDVIADLYASQPDILSAAQSGDVQAELVKVGVRHGLSPDEVRTCVEDPTVRAYTLKIASEAPAFVQGTPSLIVNGDYVENNSRDEIFALIESKLATVSIPGPTPEGPVTPNP